MEKQPHLPTMDLSNNETDCCPRFNPSLWDGKMFVMDPYKFAKATSKSILHMPINLGKVMTEAMSEITKADAMAKERYLILSRDASRWKSEHYFLVDNEVPTLEMAHIDGTYITKVFDGSYSDVPKWMKEMESFVTLKGFDMKDTLSFYTTCPKCAKHYGHNYVVLFAKI